MLEELTSCKRLYLDVDKTGSGRSCLLYVLDRAVDCLRESAPRGAGPDFFSTFLDDFRLPMSSISGQSGYMQQVL